SESFGNVSLCRTSLDDQLARKKPETGQIVLGMSEDRQVSVVVDNLVPFPSAGQIAVDFYTAGGKYRKLHLGHGHFLSPTTSGDQPETKKLVSFPFRRAPRQRVEIRMSEAKPYVCSRNRRTNSHE